MNYKKRFKLTPGRFIALSFFSVILIGVLLLSLPFSVNDGVSLSLIDRLFMATSAVCVTGLAVVDVADSFTLFGRIVMGFLIQIGGLGISLIGVSLIMLTGRKINLRERLFVKESLNYPTFNGVLSLVKTVIKITLIFEISGAVASYFVFSNYYQPLKAIEISIFHSIASFNNAGFDILGGFQSLANFKDNAFLILITSLLIIGGGFGFFTIGEIFKKRSFKKLTLHSKIVIVMTLSLLVLGTLVFKLTDNLTWLDSFFQSVTARTAGFSTTPISSFSNAGIVMFLILMFIGASPGSTGGGIKTTTIFATFASIFSESTNNESAVFKKRLPKAILHKAFVITALALILVIFATFVLCIIEPQIPLKDLLFETVSAFATVGLTTGITTQLSDLSKFIIIIIMFIGRVGPMTIATLWMYNKNTEVKRPEESISIG